jgi:addiction module HigA family antidote
MLHPSHPGEILREYMGERITVSALAEHLHVTRSTLSMILNARAGISALMSLKLDEAFGTSEGFWMRLQTNYDLAQARRAKRLKIQPVSTLLASIPTRRRAATPVSSSR